MKSETVENILLEVKGMDVDDALEYIDNGFNEVKSLILKYSVVGFPWDRLKEKGA